MKKTVRLTESDLTRIVGKVLSEQPESNGKIPACGSKGLDNMKSALNSGALEKIEFDYQNKVAFFNIKGKGRVCNVLIQDFMGMF